MLKSKQPCLPSFTISTLSIGWDKPTCDNVLHFGQFFKVKSQ